MINLSSRIEGSIGDAIIDAITEQYRPLVANAADEMEREYRQVVSSEYADRPASRRHGVRLRDSMKAEAETGQFPMNAAIDLAPGADVDKVRTLDEGGGAHSRNQRNLIPTTGADIGSPGLFSPGTDAYGGNERWFTGINHPGVRRGGNFLRRALQAGARAIRA